MTTTDCTVPQNFVSMANTLCCADDCADTEESELWLIKVPQDFDISYLNKLDTGMLVQSRGTHTLKVAIEEDKKAYYSIASFRETANTMTTVMADARGQTVLGRDVSNIMVVSETANHRGWHTDSDLLAPRKDVSLPSGLRPRYIPFGIGPPCPSVSGKCKKRKKHASKGEDVKKSSKKRKREESMQEEILQNKKRKREASPDSSAAGGDLFVLDVTGDQELVNDELPVSDSHSNSKKKKSRTM